MTSPRPARTEWYRSATKAQWQTLFAAQLGWMLDGMDVMLYAFALTTIQHEFGITSASAGLLASLPLLTAAVGGALAGMLADRYGRARVLIYSILIYSIATGLTASSTSILQLALWRSLVGFGLGAEWSAGSVLVSESWPAEHRGKAIGFMQSGWAIGYILAAILSATIIPLYGWRTLFALGMLPALLTLWIRREVPEPEIWKRVEHRVSLKVLFKPPLLRRMIVATAICTSTLFAYWGLFTWIPAYLASPVESGGAGLGLVKSAAWIIPVQIGAFFGYNLFGIFSDRLGRRIVFLIFVLAAALLVPIYALSARNPALLLALGPLIGFFGHGYFSVFGAMLSELFPSAIRATAQGICYNAGRAVSAAAPYTVGALAGTYGIGVALIMLSAFFAGAAALIFFLPETRGEELQ
jgi:MFS family permease